MASLLCIILRLASFFGDFNYIPNHLTRGCTIGYTHYFYRQKEVSFPIFQKIVNDFRKILPVLSKHISLAGSDGTGSPIITYDEILFNGSSNCGHPANEEITIPWPTDNAGGIADPFEQAQTGQWWAGALVEKRVCNGNCSYESFHFPRIFEGRDPIGKICYCNQDGPVYNEKNRVGKYFDFCKTAFRPYDWAVISCLTIIKHYLKTKVVVASDGTDNQWFDGKFLCQTELGYGLEYEIQEGELNPKTKKEVKI